MYGTKEFDDLRQQFEKDFRLLPTQTNDLSRAVRSTNPKSNFYDNGTTNALFHAYMMGYQNGKSVWRGEE